MTRTERQQFLATRIGKIGGSDMGSLLSHVLPKFIEYGCNRRLWARLSGVPSDNPDVESELMTLGNICEPVIRQAYEDQTGNRVEQHGLKQHKTAEGLQYHDDGIIYPRDGRDPGVLEVKAVGSQMWQKFQESGIVADYMVQAQAGMAVHDLTWGEFAVGVRDQLLPIIAIEQAKKLYGEKIQVLPRRPRIQHFEVQRDENIIDAIEQEAPRMLASVGKEPPPRLDLDDVRCSRCSHRKWCWGDLADGLNPEPKKPPVRDDLIELAEEYRKNIALLDGITALVDETKKKFQVALGADTAASVRVVNNGVIEAKPVYWRPQKGRQTVDSQRLLASYDALRRAAIQAGLPGVELTAPSEEFCRESAQSRPLRLQYILPPKPKKKGEVPEQDSPGDEEF